MFRMITKRNKWYRIIRYKFAEKLFLVIQTFITPLYNTVKDCVPNWFDAHFTVSNVQSVINLWSWRYYVAFTLRLSGLCLVKSVKRGKKTQVKCGMVVMVGLTSVSLVSSVSLASTQSQWVRDPHVHLFLRNKTIYVIFSDVLQV